MLNKVNNQEVRGKNFSVFVPDIHQIQYKENDHVANIGIEGEMRQQGIVSWLIYNETLMGWEPPHEYDEMSLQKREEILERVSESLTLLKMPHQFSQEIKVLQNTNRSCYQPVVDSPKNSFAFSNS